MPEGDAVWRTARKLHEALAGRTVTTSDFRVPRFATASLVGSTITEAASRGKHLLVRTDDGRTLHTHLQMDGRWRIGAPGRARRRGPWHEIRVILTNDDHEAVGFRLPVVELIGTADEARAVGHLGPDLLGPDWDADEALRRLLDAPARAVGDALLDQRNLAGIGTIYASESCFLAGVAPTTPVGAVPSLSELVNTARTLLRRGADDPAVGTRGNRTARYWVYGRRNLPCRRCGTLVTTVRLGPAGQERTLSWCPRCQPAIDDRA